MIVIAGMIRIPAERRQEIFDCLARLRQNSLEHDEGLAAYRFGIDLEQEDLLHVYEEWESTEALKAHMQKPHMDEFRNLKNKLKLETSGFSRWRAAELGQF
jgi:quinol monooxygenase YgiN